MRRRHVALRPGLGRRTRRRPRSRRGRRQRGRARRSTGGDAPRRAAAGARRRTGARKTSARTPAAAATTASWTSVRRNASWRAARCADLDDVEAEQDGGGRDEEVPAPERHPARRKRQQEEAARREGDPDAVLDRGKPPGSQIGDEGRENDREPREEAGVRCGRFDLADELERQTRGEEETHGETVPHQLRESSAGGWRVGGGAESPAGTSRRGRGTAEPPGARCG